MGCVSADVWIGIAGGIQRALIVEGGLDGEFLSLFELSGPFGANLQNFAAELMADDDRVLRHIVGNPLVVRALDGGLVGGHADAVRDHPCQDFILFHGRKVELLQPKVVFAV